MKSAKVKPCWRFTIDHSLFTINSQHITKPPRS